MDISRHAMCPGLVYICLKCLHVRVKVPADAKRHVTATQTSRKPCVGTAIILKLQKKLHYSCYMSLWVSDHLGIFIFFSLDECSSHGSCVTIKSLNISSFIKTVNTLSCQLG